MVADKGIGWRRSPIMVMESRSQGCRVLWPLLVVRQRVFDRCYV